MRDNRTNDGEAIRQGHAGLDGQGQPFRFRTSHDLTICRNSEYCLSNLLSQRKGSAFTGCRFQKVSDAFSCFWINGAPSPSNNRLQWLAYG